MNGCETDGCGRVFTTAFRAANRVEDLPLAGLTGLRVGGPARVVSLMDAAHLDELLDRAGPLRMLGNGTNVLVADAGVRDLVVRLGSAWRDCEVCGGETDTAIVRCGAACRVARLLRLCAEHGLVGLAGLGGLPATVGGAVATNAGAGGTWIGDHLRCVEVASRDDPRPRWVPADRWDRGYREGGLAAGTIVLAVELGLLRDDPARERAAQAEHRRRRAVAQPLDRPSAGCFFRNPPGESAGRLIDALDMKGMRIGGAEVSAVHANFLINAGGARAVDFVALVRAIRERVYNQRGIRLDLEVETWGIPELVGSEA